MKRKTRICRKYWNLIYKKVFIFKNHEIDLEATCKQIRRYRKIINRYKSYAQILQKDYSIQYDYDSLESIQGHLFYISDRFTAAFRLAWLVNVPEKVDELLKQQSKNQ